MCVLGSLLASILAGIGLGFTSPTIDTMRNTVTSSDGIPLILPDSSGLHVLEDSSASIFSAALTVGALIGALIAGPLADSIGRRLALAINSPLGVAAYLTIGLSSNVYLLIMARFIAGLPVGIGPSVVSVYISEVAPTRLRGLLGACNEMACVLGITAVYAIGLIFRTDGGDSTHPLITSNTFCNWRLTSFVCIAPCILLAITMYFALESPRWLASRQRIVEAQCIICKLRGSHTANDPRISSEIIDLTNSSDHGIRFIVRLRELLVCKKQLLVAITIQVLTQLSGLDVIAFYLVTIFQDAHLSFPDLMAVTVQLATAIAIIPACLLVERSGRRPLLLLSSIGMCISLAVIGTYFFLDNPSFAWLSVVGAYGYNLFYAFGVGPIRWVLVTEIFPDNCRSLAAGIATMASWLTLFIIILSIDVVTENTSLQAVFWFFSGVSAVITCFVWIAVPETKGKSFEDIRRLFYSSSTNS